MATGQIPQANVATKGFGFDNSQYQSHEFAQVVVAANATTVLFCAPAASQVYDTNFTVVTAGGGAGDAIIVRKVAANNGANLSSNIVLGNTVTIGTNATGNVATTGPYTYNVFANGVASGSNTANTGGFSLLPGDMLLAVANTAAGVVVAVTEYSINVNAQVLA